MPRKSKLLSILFLWVFCAIALAAVPARAIDSNLEGQLQSLKTSAQGQTLEAKAALGAALIKSASPENQKEVAGRVAQLLAGIKDDFSDNATLAGLLAKKLPGRVAASVAGSIAIGAGAGDPAQLPQITAAVIASQSATIDQAGAIAQEVTASAPLSQASSIASAIGAMFAEHPRLANKSPEIAAGITRALLAKEASLPEIRSELANSIAALTVLLPGSISSNKNLIIKIGREVATLIAKDFPGLATTIVGITGGALQSAAGSDDISTVLDGFEDEFKSRIDDPIIKEKLDKVISEIRSGTSDKQILPLEKQPDPNPAPAGGGSGGGGWIAKPETDVVNG